LFLRARKGRTSDARAKLDLGQVGWFLLELVVSRNFHRDCDLLVDSEPRMRGTT
jgi:hypothetical protein